MRANSSARLTVRVIGADGRALLLGLKSLVVGSNHELDAGAKPAELVDTTVLVGRSLRRVEEQERDTELIAGAAWLVALVALAAAAGVAAWVWPPGAKAR